MSDPNSLLKQLAQIPDLLQIARKHSEGTDPYAILKRLEGEYRSSKRPFQIPTLYRHMDICSTRKHTFGAATILVVNPRGESVQISALELHEIKEHGAKFNSKVMDFLEEISSSVVTPTLSTLSFPGNLEIDFNVKGAFDETLTSDSNWKFSDNLIFKGPTHAEFKAGPFPELLIQASITNPTEQEIKVVVWQVHASSPLSLSVVENNWVKLKPIDRTGPPNPSPVPRPPMSFFIPPKTILVFDAVAPLHQYEYSGAPTIGLKWNFYLWKVPEKTGHLNIQMPAQ